jgi:hypothetical protein
VSILDITVASVVAFTLASLSIISLRLFLINRALTIRAMQAELDRITVYEQAQSIFKSEREKYGNSDGFINFMAKSRDWAFEYIETVQNDLYELNDVFKSVDGAPRTLAQTNALSEAIRKVLKNLPDEEKR